MTPRPTRRRCSARPAPAPSTWRARPSRRWPSAHGLPFIAVRVIVDRAAMSCRRRWPRRAARGTVALWPSAPRSAARAAARSAPLMRLARRYRAASRSLAAVARPGQLDAAVAPPRTSDASASHEGAGHRRHRLRGRRGGEGVAARGLAGPRAGARGFDRRNLSSLAARDRRRRSHRPGLARARRSPVARRCFTSRRTTAWARATRSSCIGPTSKARAISWRRRARAGVAAHRLHQQRRDDRACPPTARPATRRRRSRSPT